MRDVDGVVARFLRARSALPDERERAQVGLLGVSALLHLAPDEALRLLAGMPPALQVVALEMAVAESRPPASDAVRQATIQALEAWPRGWDSKEIALGLWAGMPLAEQMTAKIEPLLRWEPVAMAVEWAAVGWDDAEAWGARLIDHPGLEDRIRIAMLRARALAKERVSLERATALVLRIDERVMRLSAMFELALAESAPGELGPRWAEIALAAGSEAVDYLEAWERSARMAAVLARVGDPRSGKLADETFEEFDARPAKERVFYYTTLVRPAAAMGPERLRDLVDRLGREAVMMDATRVEAATEAAHALRFLAPEDGCRHVFERLGELGRRAFEGPGGLKGLAYLVRAAVRTKTRPPDVWLAAIGDRLRKLAQPPAQPMDVARAARTIAAVDDEAAAALEAAAPPGLVRGLWALGRLQAALDG